MSAIVIFIGWKNSKQPMVLSF